MTIGEATMFGYKEPYINSHRGISIYSEYNKRVFGAYITMAWYRKVDNELVFYQSHAICGFICKNTRYVYDSNSLRSYRLDWLKEPARVAEYMNRRYGMHTKWENTKLEYTVVYK